jgi:glycosyltransferase involved in cell wall biosynthesis
MTTRPSVLFVHHRAEGGGAPTSLALLIEQLGADIDATVLCPPGAAAERFALAGADVVTGPVASFTHIWASVYRRARWALALRELERLPQHALQLDALLRRLRPHIVHLNDAPLVPAALLSRRRGVPVVWHLRSSLPEAPSRRSEAMRAAVSRLADSAIAIDADVARSYGAPNVEVIFNPVAIPPPVDDRESAAAKERLGLDATRMAVGMLGYLYALKGWPDLLTAVADVRRSGLSVSALLVGGTVRPGEWFETPAARALVAIRAVRNEQSDLAGSIASLGLEDSVTILPFGTDIDDVYRALDVVCFPNRGLGIGRPILEGQAFGRAVVASGSVDGAGIIEDGVTGLLVPRSNPAGLAAALRIVADPETRARIGSAGRAHAARSYAPEVVAEALARLYHRVLLGGAHIATGTRAG